MKAIYYDCFAGISGDMNLGAMVDLGVDKNILIGELKKLGLDGWDIVFSKDSRGGIFGTKADVILAECQEESASSSPCEHSHNDANKHLHEREPLSADTHACGHTHAHSHEHENESEANHGCEHAHHEHHEHHEHHVHHAHRTFGEIKKIIEASQISQNAKNITLKIFEKVALAEAKVHGKNIDEVHFHEVGALDSIIDIVGAAICIDILKVEKFLCSKIELGGGTVKCAHGIMPVPAPATAEILKGFNVKINGAPHECTTPTGAAIIAALCEYKADVCDCKILANGVGIGHRNSPALPNILRASLLELDENPEGLRSEKMQLVEANIDDMTGEELAFVCEKLFEAGALDVWQESISMKKSRLAVKLCALANAKNAQDVLQCMLIQSSSLGARVSEVNRVSIARKNQSVETSLGVCDFKIANVACHKKIKPEFEHCKKIAVEKNMPIQEVVKILKNEFKD